MSDIFKKNGFTLVELAIVMTIIGLLIGGILKGQELLENARVTSTIAQVKAYDAAVTAFRDIYDGLPGDLRRAENRLPGCNAKCTSLNDPATGNGIVGAQGWGGDDYGGVYIPQDGSDDENVLFWLHLQKANLINGVADITSLPDGHTKASFGVTNPSAKIGGGFMAGNMPSVTGTFPVISSSGTFSGGLSLLLTTLLDQIQANVVEGGFEGTLALTPVRAGQIDRKMDDGVPDTGHVVGYGLPTCAADSGTGAGYIYQESLSGKDCILIIRIQS